MKLDTTEFPICFIRMGLALAVVASLVAFAARAEAQPFHPTVHAAAVAGRARTTMIRSVATTHIHLSMAPHS